MSAMIELRRRSEVGIFAVPYRARCSGQALRIPDGAIVETPTADQMSDAPEKVTNALGLAAGGVPATIHHANLGLIKSFLSFEGMFLLSNGMLAAIYGAEPVPIH